MSRYGMLALMAVITMATQLCAAVLEMDFEKPFVAVQAAPGRSQVGGEICPPMIENSSGWASVDMRFARLTEGAFAGKASQRVEVTAIREGRAQAWVELPAMAPGRYARLKLAARAPQSGGLDVAIRMAGAPYTQPWEKHLALSPEWKVFDLLVPAVQYRPDTKYVLMFYFGVGVTDIDAVSLEEIDVEKLVADAPVKQGNLLQTSSFAMALPSPWALASGPIGAKAEMDRSERGPTGAAALKLMPGFAAHNMPMFEQVALVSPPIAMNQMRAHTVSLYLKGSEPQQQVWVKLVGPNGPEQARDFRIGTQWQRYTATVTLPYIVDGFANLRVEGSKTFWLDGLQVEEGQKASEFRRAQAVDLQVKASRPFGVYADEPMRVSYAVVGQVPAGAMIAGNLVDPYGRKHAIAPVACGVEGELELPVHGQMPYGTFVAELRLSDAQGKPVGEWAEAVVHRVHKARMVDRDAPESPFGIHIDPIPEYAQMVKQLGFNWVRIHDASAYLTKWYFLEDKPDHFDFARADAGVKLFRDNRLMILGMLDTSPTWRSRNQTKSWFEKYYIPTPESMEKWSAYCREVVSRYKGDIHHWEVWNEPYVNDFFRLRDTDQKGGYEPGTPADYVKLLEPAYKAAKAADPNCTVLWSNASGKWAQGCAQNKAYEFCDLASFHNYTNSSPLAFLDFGHGMKDMRSYLPEKSQQIAFWNTEGGIGATNDPHILAHTAKPGDLAAALETAEFLVRYQVACQVYGAKKFFEYTFHYHGWNASWDLLLPDGSLPPHGSAQSAMMWHLEGRPFKTSVPVAKSYGAHVFAGPDADVVVVVGLSLEGEALQMPKLPEGCVLRDLFGNERPAPMKLDRSVWYITTPAGRGEDVAKMIAAAGRRS